MYIGFLLPMDSLSGGSFVVCEHATRLEKAGHRVALIFRSTPMHSGPTASQAYSLTTMNWVDARSEQFDIAVATWWETLLHVFELRSRAFAYFVQSDERRFYPEDCLIARHLVELTYRWSVPTITIASWIQDMFRREFGKSVAVAPNGVSSEIFHPEQPLTRRKDRALRVLIEGPGGVEFKRVGFAFEVARQVENIEIWHIASDGVVDPAWQADRTFPPQPQQEMRFIYSSCDVLLKFSTVEGFFGPPLEMMACGGTAIVGAVSGFEEYIVDGENALVVPLDDLPAAVQALTRLRDDRQLLAQLKAGGAETAKKMSWERSTGQFEEFLHGVLALPDESKPKHAEYIAAYGRALWSTHLALSTLVSREDMSRLERLVKTAQNLDSEADHLAAELAVIRQQMQENRGNIETLVAESPIARSVL